MDKKNMKVAVYFRTATVPIEQKVWLYASSKSSEFSEFSRTFEVPETIDPFTVSAVLKDNTLVIEAPLLCTV